MTDTFAVIASSDTLTIEPDFVEPKSRYEFQAVVIPGASPNASVDERAGIMRWTGTYVWQLQNKIDLFNFFWFWRGRKARLRGFWLPTWLSDFSAAAGTGTNQGYLDVHTNGFESTFAHMSDLSNPPYTRATGLENDWAVMLIVGGDRHFRVIDTFVDQGGGVHRMTFKTAGGSEYLPDNLAVDDFDLISLVPWCRFESNKLSLRFRGSSDVAEASLSVTELYFEAPTL